MNKLKSGRFLLILLLMLGAHVIKAQTTKITGSVYDSSDHKALEGATIKNLSTNKSVTVKGDGSFSISATDGQKLLVSFIGYSPKTIIASDNLQILLSSKSADQEGVVVVAMDMKRKPRELGYSVQTVSGKDIQQTQRENFINALQGRVAGVTVTPTNGQAGASSQIILRGFNSASLNNQPLFVVDGIIMDNTTFNETSNGGSGIGLADDRPNRSSDYSNRMSDMNPNDIASITVLKGPEATALYGSQASSGAIVITTKHAQGNGVRLAYDNSFRFNKVTRFQKVIGGYAPGASGMPITNTENSFTYFGPQLASGVKTYDNIKDFFQTGFANTQNIAADFGSKNVGFRLSGSFFDNSGTIPNNSYKRYNLKLSNTIKVGDKLTISPSIAFINTSNVKPMRGAGGYLLDLYAWPTTDMASNYEDAAGNKRLLYATDPTQELIDNPFFSANRNYGKDNLNRWMATLGIDYHPFDWLTVAGRFGYDTYKQNGFTITDPQTTSSNLATALQGYLTNYYLTYKGYNHTITATATKKVGKFNLRGMVGTMWQDYEQSEFALAGSNLKDYANTAGHSTDSSNIGVVQSRLQRNYNGLPNESITRQLAYFGEASLGYNDVLFISYTHRFETASVFPTANRHYNYPGISFSAIMSDILPGIKGKFLNYWKIRASRASTARLMPPYLNQSVFVNNYASSAVGQAYSYSYYNNNPDLRPERQKTYEIGTELKMLNNRVSLEAAYYNTHNIDQISVGFRASYGTGYVLNTQNATESRNQGVEITLNVNPIKKADFNWNIQFNFNHMWSNVIAIPKSIDGYSDYYISDTWIAYNARGGFVRNQPTTIITGYSYQRNNKGQILINPSTGLPLINQSFKPIGNRNPKFALGTVNTFRYKNWDLSFLWDLRVGGDIFNATDMYLTQIGRSERTADRMKARVINGVLNDGLQNSDNPTKNSISIVPYYNSTAYYGETTGMPDEEFVQKNVNWFRLRDVTLSYQFPQSITNRIKGLKGLAVFATGNDLLLFTNYRGGDPAVNGNTAGTVGVGGFGMDYGNVATPVSYNFGLKANF
ncbi:SusC/RagA family TonB-linked outer membrane protein [Rhizosphaericola mali]|uniref:SusC/RagA family TonB-linked outer membrane protein n=1 Tax=Rhizosphaericola mali TaxID=2545455 RepID=A0A5P2FWC3_9BACT|nr:SusC/RagA family TonB-linked outer membrane protein [Rhizosphaericola mali]QES87824.1 SusC/RagA family TonB-linked outer membrane protein [Rhizosphaericola mali]